MSPPGDKDMPWRRYKPIDPRHHYIRARAHLGRRGFFLVLLGIIWIAQGVAAITAPGSTSYLLLAHGWGLRAAVWIITGAVAIWYSTRPQGEDALGFLALYLMAAYRAVAYGVGFLMWALPNGQDGDPRGVIGLLSWGVVIVAILIVAGWRESPEETLTRQGHP